MCDITWKDIEETLKDLKERKCTRTCPQCSREDFPLENSPYCSRCTDDKISKGEPLFGYKMLDLGKDPTTDNHNYVASISDMTFEQMVENFKDFDDIWKPAYLIEYAENKLGTFSEEAQKAARKACDDLGIAYSN